MRPLSPVNTVSHSNGTEMSCPSSSRAVCRSVSDSDQPLSGTRMLRGARDRLSEQGGKG